MIVTLRRSVVVGDGGRGHAQERGRTTPTPVLPWAGVVVRRGAVPVHAPTPTHVLTRTRRPAWTSAPRWRRPKVKDKGER